VEYGLVQLWKSWGVEAEGMLGHSIGEYVGACVAGVMTLEEALGIVAVRGKLMQGLPRSGMVAVEMGEEELGWAVEKGVSVAAVNGPGLCVLSGVEAEMEWVEEELKRKGVNYKRLKTSHGFHSRVVEGVMGAFLEEMKKVKLKAPKVGLISNVSGRWMGKEAEEAEYWVKHLREGVQFEKGLKELVREGEWMLVECGPGQSLRRLAQRQGLGERTVASLPVAGSGGSEVEKMMQAAGELWKVGVGIDWGGLHGGERGRRVPLPTYPFERKRYWIEPAERTEDYKQTPERQPVIRKTNDVSQWFWHSTWTLSKKPNFEAVQPEIESTWLLFADDTGIATEIAHRLEQAGHHVIKVNRGQSFEQKDLCCYTINPEMASDYRELMTRLYESGRSVTRIVHFWGLDVEHQQESGADFFKKSQSLGILNLLYTTQAMNTQPSGSQRWLWAISSRTMQVESRDRVIAEKTGPLAFCKILPQEDQSFAAHVIDIDPPQNRRDLELTVENLLRELRSDAADPVVAYRGPYRWVQNCERIRPNPGAASAAGLQPGGVYLITGGMGAVGLLIAEWIAKAVKAKLVLVGRSELPPASEWTKILVNSSESESLHRIKKVIALEQLGAEVAVMQADVSDRVQMKAVLDRSRERFGRVNGIIHGAGVTSGPSVFRLARDVRPEDCEMQARPKACGVRVLKEILTDGEVDFVMCLSSNASVLGGLGFTAYAAANLFLDAFVQRQQAELPKTRWIGTNWDHWPEETKKIANARTSMDEFAMTRDQAEEAFFKVLALQQDGQIIIATGNLQQRMNLWINRRLKSTQPDGEKNIPDAVPKTVRPRVKTAYVAPRNKIEESLTAIWADSLGVDRVGVNDDFFELGGHSLLATKFLVQIRETFDLDFPLAKFFEGPTVAQMAAYLNEIAEQEAESGPEHLVAAS
jgi:NAD(P)-dependent dehydrogenase (short-subunit alcohol dehydrogenase family)/acyl carrier protein